MNDQKSAVFEREATIADWDEDYYHPIAVQYYDRAIPDMLRMMGVKRGDRVLDAGCGPGVHSIRAAREGLKVIAIDISEAMLSVARSEVANARLQTQVEFHQEDLCKLSFADESFRHVFSWGVIIHIHDVEKALDELARIVAPGGTLGLYVTNAGAFDQKLEKMLRFILGKPLAYETFRLGNGRWYQMNDEKLWVWQFDISELQRQMEARGLKLINRTVGEFSEIQRRVKGSLRRGLLHLNNFLYRRRFSPNYGITNILVFQKEKRDN